MKTKSKLLIVLIVALLSHCREPFEPDFKTGINDYLVVEGFIRVGQDAVTEIKLSRVSSLNAETTQLEQGAQVFIQGSDGASYPVKETTFGLYRSDTLDLDADTEYRLFIRQKNGIENASDYATALPTPEIDSVYWQLNNGVNMIVATHGPTDGPRFFSWDYTETWEIRSDHRTNFKYENGQVKRRPNAEMSAMRICWQNDYPTDIIFGSTEQLTENVTHQVLTTLSNYTDKLLVRYSILTEQRAISEEEYRYLQLMMKNTTNTGSLFDPMPSEIYGNIVCISSPETPVIGYVGVSLVSSKRIFILRSELGIPPPARCELEIITEDEFVEFFEFLGYLPVDSLGVSFQLDPLERPVYNGAPRFCLDCRYRGNPERPDFW